MTCGSVKDHFNEQPITRRNLPWFVRGCRKTARFLHALVNALDAVRVCEEVVETHVEILFDEKNSIRRRQSSSLFNETLETPICVFEFSIFMSRWEVAVAVQLVNFSALSSKTSVLMDKSITPTNTSNPQAISLQTDLQVTHHTHERKGQ